MNYKQHLIDHLVLQNKLNYGDDVLLGSVGINVPEYIRKTAINLIETNHKWYLDNLVTSTRTYRLPEYQLSCQYATLVLGGKSYLLFPCEIEERFPSGKSEANLASWMWSRYGKSIDISVVLFPSDDDWKNIYDVNREVIIKNYLRYEEEQEKIRIQLDKEQSVINKYHIN